MNFMTIRIGVLTATLMMVIDAGQNAVASESNPPIMRIFEFVLDPSDVQAILEAGRKNIEASVRSEPGVLSMYCAIDKNDPNKLYVVEVYHGQVAYQSHVESPHFKEFRKAIQGKVLSQKVTETSPAILGAKKFNWPNDHSGDSEDEQY